MRSESRMHAKMTGHKVFDDAAIVIFLGLLIRWGVSLYPYSGAGKPPMFGDYEAQRHWQEITVNLDVKDWYRNSSRNDLMYWGLDYPPLTAYHSYAIGMIAQKLNDNYTALNSSRGYESYEHKLFMRYTVLAADVLVYIPAVLYFKKALQSSLGESGRRFLVLQFLLYPGIILVDHGHFQYNNVSLGLLVAAVALILKNKIILASVFFVLAINYKQMELYHALPFFCYLLGQCFRSRTYLKGVSTLFKLAIAVIVTFGLIWLPFIRDLECIQAVLTRVFPVARGLFEDKVANLWCALSIFIKWKDLFNNSSMAIICLVTTTCCCLPSCINLFVNPTTKHFRYSLVNIAFVFFLFSFHVHEKSILLVAIPACMLYSEEPFMVSWLLAVSNFSMLPLLYKDGLFIPYFSLSVISVMMCLWTSNDTAAKTLTIMRYPQVLLVSFIGIACLTLSFVLVQPPQRYPFLWLLLIALYSCAHFMLFTAYFHFKQLTLSSKSKMKAKRM